MKHLASLLFVLSALPACKSKKTDDKPAVTPGSASGTAATTEPTPPPAAAKTVTVPAGVANFGCLGWSKTAKAAACITGESALGEDAKFALTYLGGSEPPTPITVKQGGGEDMFDDVTAANASLAKLGVEPFDAPAKELEPGKVTDLGNGASIDWKTKETKPGGDNEAPTIRHEVTLTCANKSTAEVLKLEEEGHNPEIRVWTAPEHLVIDLETFIGREGESRRISTPKLVGLADCK